MKIYVGHLPYETSEDDLKNLFTKYGEVADIRLIYDTGTGRSKGFAFIEMPNQAEAIKALTELNGFEISQRKIIVNEAQDKSKSKGNHRKNGRR